MTTHEDNIIVLGIDGAVLQELAIIPTPGGPVLHMLRADAPNFGGFGEIYFSEVEPGAIKGWKKHREQTQYFAVPVGLLKIVLVDERTYSPTKDNICEVILGRPDNYHLLRIPPHIWYAFTAVGDTPALICNCADIPHNPKESTRKELDTIPYVW